MTRKVFLGSILLVTILGAHAQDAKSLWVDSVFQKLNLEEKVGQLFMVQLSTDDAESIDQVERQIENHHVGGILISGGGPVNTARAINQFQKKSKYPLLIGIHAEWGLGHTMDSMIMFQKPLVLSAIQNDSLVYRMGQEIARQMKLLGIQVNFAPQIDILSERDPTDDFLEYYGNSQTRVGRTAKVLTRGMIHEGIMVVPKHFGNDRDESDVQLQRLNEEQIQSFYPFKEWKDLGVQGLATSHLHFSMPDDRQSLPASLSESFIKDYLRTSIGFQGLTFAEVPYLQNVKTSRDQEPEEFGFLIGNDILIDPQNISQAVKQIMRDVRRDQAIAEQLDQTVLKILRTKYEMNLVGMAPIDLENLHLKLNTPFAQVLNHELAEAAVTVLENDENVIPIKSIENHRFISLSVGESNLTDFNHYLSNYAQFQNHSILALRDTTGIQAMLMPTDVVVVSLYPESHTFKEEIAAFIKTLATTNQVIVCHFGNVFDLEGLDGLPTILAGYTDRNVIQKVSAQIIFGGMKAEGRFPLTVSDTFTEGKGVNTTTLNRLSYTLPEAAGFNRDILDRIKAIQQEAIDLKATPGSFVMVARNGKVVFEQAVGYQSYDQETPVTDRTIYDLASVTKVSATLQAVMFLYEKGLIDLNKKASYYLPELQNSNKKDIILKDILTHQAGLWPYLPFWSQTIKENSFMPEYYNVVESEEYPVPVAKDLFAAKTMKDSLWQWIIKSRVRDKPLRTPYNYTYSDMGFYILQHLAEKLLNQPLEDFVFQNLYEPLGAYSLGFLPLLRFSPDQIAPTENDKDFRKSLLVGYVHDQGAAMHGGVAGHAGLFGSANDLIKLGQMWLKSGTYGGVQYYKPETITFFTQSYYDSNRRGLGWDKPVRNEWNSPTSVYASPLTFGHTGFTGTAIWVDPEFDLVYVFLSNRVNPEATNNKLLDENIRTRIQEEIYLALFERLQYQN